MKKNKILLSTLVAVTLLSVTANALSIDKAVELALINNNVLKEQVFKIKEKSGWTVKFFIILFEVAKKYILLKPKHLRW